jgi:hypothetical protein
MPFELNDLFFGASWTLSAERLFVPTVLWQISQPCFQETNESGLNLYRVGRSTWRGTGYLLGQLVVVDAEEDLKSER